MADSSALIHAGVTPREIEVLRAVQEHLSNAEIAARLFVSERTVESHVSSLLRKLQVDNRRELARLGRTVVANAVGDPPTNLPSRSTAFMGRTEELDALEEAIRRHPLLTLVGPAGVGKTRLALEAALRVRPQYPGGTWFVDFAAVRPDRVPHAVANVLNLAAQPGEELAVTIPSALAYRPATLVILDDCDQLVEAVGDLAASIVASGGPARIVATSRQVFGTEEECLFPVSPLAEDACVELFFDRARRTAPNVVLTDSDAETVTRICRHLDHLPLAIELAATQIRILEPTELAKRLDDRFRILSRPRAGSRHGSIAATVRWSYEQLHEPAKRVFERLSIFAGSCTLEAAQAVCGRDGLDGHDVLGLIGDLVDRSLLARERGPDGVARYRMLETLRLYGRESLEATGDLGRFCKAHATYYLALSGAAEPHLFGREESTWVARLRAEEPNLRHALDWARDHDVELALRFGVALWQYWNFSWRNQEGVAYLQSLLELRGDTDTDDPDRSVLRAWALTAAASLSAYNREAARTTAWAQEAIHAFAAAGEERGLAYARLALGWALANLGSLEQADDVLGDVIAGADHLNDQVLMGLALECRGHVASWRGDFEESSRWHQLELANWTEVGSRRQQAWAYTHLAHVARSAGDLEHALEFTGRALDGLAGDPGGSAHVHTTLADVARLQGRGEEAARIYEELLARFGAAGDQRCLASTYKNLGELAAGRGAHEEALGLFFESIKLRRQLGDQLGVAECLRGVAAVAFSTGRADDSVILLAAASGLRKAAGAEPLPEERRAADAVLTAARASLTAEQFGRAWDTGTNLDTDAAVEQAYLLGPVPSLG
jgi:predicted ATPase/DNA-binding CsgD family transcriptional regulator/tetratricopeptide (TPR) repeat protein